MIHKVCPLRYRLLQLMAGSIFALSAGRVDAEGLQYPLAIAVADSGTLFVADRGLPGIWRLHNNQLQVYFRGDKQLRTPMNAIRCIELDREGRLLVGDSATRDVYRFDTFGRPQPLTRLSSAGRVAEAAPPRLGRVGNPMDIAVNKSGDVFVSDLEIGRVLKLDRDGGDVQLFAQIAGCRGLFVDRHDNLWVVSTTPDQLYCVAPDGRRKVVVAGIVFGFPHDVVVDDQGVAYVSDGYGPAIWKITAGGEPRKFLWGQPLVNPVGLALHDGKLYVADPRAKAIFQIDSAGQLSKLEIGASQD